jgi:hypothetical protein
MNEMKWDDLRVGMRIYYSDASSRQLHQLLTITKLEPKYFESFMVITDYGRLTVRDTMLSKKDEWQTYGHELRGFSEASDTTLYWFVKEIFKTAADGRFIEHIARSE